MPIQKSAQMVLILFIVSSLEISNPHLAAEIGIKRRLCFTHAYHLGMRSHASTTSSYPSSLNKMHKRASASMWAVSMSSPLYFLIDTNFSTYFSFICLFMIFTPIRYLLVNDSSKRTPIGSILGIYDHFGNFQSPLYGRDWKEYDSYAPLCSASPEEAERFCPTLAYHLGICFHASTISL